MGGIHAFSIAGIPVAISPWFLVLLYLYGRGDLQRGMLWAASITVSLLVHELGHALVAKNFGLAPRILLHGFGGLTQHERADNGTHEALIIATGPAAGLLLGLVAFAGALLARSQGVASLALWTALEALLYVNVFWSAVNLLPLWPLDGGQLFRLGMLRLLAPRIAHRVTHGLALLLLAAVLWFFARGSTFGIVLVLFLAWDNVRAFGASSEMSTSRAPTQRAEREILERAQAHLAEGNAREAVRLGHQLRAQSNLAGPILGEVWALLGLGTARLGNHDEAVRYLRRATPTPETREALRECLRALGAEDEVDAVVQEQTARRRGDAAGRWLQAVLAFDVLTVALAIGYWVMG